MIKVIVSKTEQYASQILSEHEKEGWRVVSSALDSYVDPRTRNVICNFCFTLQRENPPEVQKEEPIDLEVERSRVDEFIQYMSSAFPAYEFFSAEDLMTLFLERYPSSKLSETTFAKQVIYVEMARTSPRWGMKKSGKDNKNMFNFPK